MGGGGGSKETHLCALHVMCTWLINIKVAGLSYKRLTGRQNLVYKWSSDSSRRSQDAGVFRPGKNLTLCSKNIPKELG